MKTFTEYHYRNSRRDYKIRLSHHRDSSKRLLAVFSHAPWHSFQYQRFGLSVLRVAERNPLYFTRNSGCLAREIIDFCLDIEIDHLILIGCSKGGYGAALAASTIAEELPNLKINLILFSPILSLFPINYSLPYPSYKHLIELSHFDRQVAYDLAENGYLRNGLCGQNLSITCVYGQLNPLDRLEASKLPADSNKIELMASTHMSVLPFICNTQSDASIRRAVNSLYGISEKDADIAYLLGQESAARLITELSTLPPQPRLPEFINLCIQREAQCIRYQGICK